MSEFGENSFGDPTIDNPFADPAVQQVTRNANAQTWVQDYNPFNQQQHTQESSQPAVMQLSTDPLPIYTHNSQQTRSKPNVDLAELQRRQEELDRKQEELTRREEEMRHNTYNIRHNNWPPLPKLCCFRPCFYQDIQIDIPVEFQKIVRQLYHLWIFHMILTALNVLGGIIAIDFTVICLGIFYMLIFTPFSYICWFRPAYKAFRSDSSFSFMVFFFMFFFQLVVTAIQALGIPHSGTIGIISAINKFKQSNNAAGTIIAILQLLIAGGFCCAVVADLSLISTIHRVYSSTGASFAKAQSEFSRQFARNQRVRNAASNIAAAAVQTQLPNLPR